MNQDPRPDSTTHVSTAGSASRTVVSPASSAENLPLTFAGLTHVGLVRTNNEDQLLIVRLHKSLEILQTTLPADQLLPLSGREGHVVLVADGIGGRAGGELASAIAVKGAAEYLLGAAKWFFRLDDPDEAVRLRLLREGLDRIDRKILDESTANPRLKGMGTTLTAASIIGPDVFIVHVGDSRAYLLHSGELRQVTTDHTLTQHLVEQGLMTADDARHAPMHNVLINALGGKPGVTADIVKFRLNAGDRLLLCTDGLTEHVTDQRITDMLLAEREPARACEVLVEAALQGGGSDNVTVIVAAAG